MKPFKFIFIFFILIGCAKSKLTNFHYGEYTHNRIPYDSILKVRVSTLSLPKQIITEEKAKTFFDLRDSIPNRFLIEIGAKSTKPEDIINAMKTPLSTVDKKTGEMIKTVDESEIKVRFLFSNIKKYYNDPRFIHPNTRLEILNTKLTLNSDTIFSIKEIDRIENEIDFIDLGTLEREQSVKFGSKLNASLSATLTNEGNTAYSDKINDGNTSGSSNNFKTGDESTFGNSSSNTNAREKLNSNSSKNTISATKGVSGEATYNNDEIIKEALVGKLQRMKVGFSFDSKSIELSQHGAILTDVVDNVVVTATIKASTQFTTSKMINQFDNLFHKKSGKYNHPDSLSSTYFKLKYVPCEKIGNAGIDATINVEGLVRAVENTKNRIDGGTKGQSVFEFDDRVEYFTLTDAKTPIAISIPKFSFCKDIYQINCTVEGKGSDEYCLTLKMPYDYMCYFIGGENLVELESWLNFAIKQKDLSFFKSKISLSFISTIAPHEEIVLTGENPNLEMIGKIKQIKVMEFRD